MDLKRRAKARRWMVITLGCGCACGALMMLGSSIAIRRAAQGRLYCDVATIPHRRVGLLLGCSKRLGDGRENLFFRYRIEAAARLFAAGKVDYLLVSGDNHRKDYDESSDMKFALARLGVPAERVYCDYAGFRTLDSLVRAKEVFGQTELTIISQEFHNQRAVYIAGRRGIDAVAFSAQAVTGCGGLRTLCREQLARVKTVLDVHVLRTRPKFLGPKIAIGPTDQVGSS